MGTGYNVRFTHVSFVRHCVSLVLLLLGTVVPAFSVAVAFGWGHKTLPVLATTVAFEGYGSLIAGYFLLRRSDWEPVVSAYVKLILLLGSGLLIPGIAAVLIRLHGDQFPFVYFILTGCSSILAYLWFRVQAQKAY